MSLETDIIKIRAELKFLKKIIYFNTVIVLTNIIGVDLSGFL